MYVCICACVCFSVPPLSPLGVEGEMGETCYCFTSHTSLTHRRGTHLTTDTTQDRAKQKAWRIIIHHQNKSSAVSPSLSVCLSVLLWCNPFHLPCFQGWDESKTRMPLPYRLKSCIHCDLITETRSIFEWRRFLDTGISYQNLQMYPIIKSRKVKHCLACRLAVHCTEWLAYNTSITAAPQIHWPGGCFAVEK